ncbi:MAG: PQQ-binding-like beta-propeller repeat protein [Ignavibacteriales bacterium]|nr:MAG: PQQ-binding-like beta-propeller repeat protein [Ignavibacteriales bacterium]
MKIFWLLIMWWLPQTVIPAPFQFLHPLKEGCLPYVEGDSPKVKWKFKTGGALFSSPVITGTSVIFGSLDASLYSLNTETGNLNWKFKTNGEIRSTVCVDNEKIFLVCGDGLLYSINKNNGTLNWTFKTDGEQTYKYYGYADYFKSSPVLFNDAVYFGSGDGNIYSINSTSGKLIWKFKTGDVVHSTPVIYNGKLFAGSFDGFVYAIDVNTGELIWKFKSVGQRFFPKGEMQGNPVVANNLVYIGSRDYNLYAIDADEGYCHWNKQFPKGWALALSVYDSVLYAGASDDDVMISINGKTGQENWRTNVNFNTFGAPAFGGSRMYFGTLLGKLLALDIYTGEIAWSFNTDNFNSNSKHYFEDKLKITKSEFYSKISSPEDYIKALYKLGALFSTPAVNNDVIIFTSTDGSAYCLEK